MITKEIASAHADSLTEFASHWNGAGDGADEVVFLLGRAARLMRKVARIEGPTPTPMRVGLGLEEGEEAPEPIDHRTEAREG